MRVISLHTSEQKIIAQAIKKSRKAQEQLYQLHASKMLSVCRYYINDLQEAEDVMVTAFFKAFQKLNTYEGEGNFQGWLRRITVNECISFLRKKKQLSFTDAIEEYSNNVENSINNYFDVAEIQEMIDDLPGGYKTVFVLYAIEGYKHQEIADMLQISLSTSKSQLFKARKVLQEKIKELNTIHNGTR
ncbi:RNA polymerase sigma factor [Pseudofulvibacter geojedonensis]|uniref:RNA polymerase sigma factor n=1 Tax=Pseudofulvibacter geojedonensis TaxID=1123758 RepID=A0ABW3I123_9FLAO